jgi:hypothetical protein
MSQSPFASLPSPAPSSPELQEAEARAVALCERASRNLRLARDGVVALKLVLEHLCNLAGTFERVSLRLSALGASAGTAASERPAAVEFLVDVGRRSAAAIRELETSMRMSVAASDKLIGQTDEGQRALTELIPAVRELGAAAARASTRPPTLEVVVRPPSNKLAPETSDDKIASFLQSIWPSPAGGSGKN